MTQKNGSTVSYCSIGASSVYIPLREINTYLVSELFDKFAVIRRNIPRQTDVEQIAIEALAKGAQSSDKIYDFLYHEIREGVTGEYERFCGDWKYVREHGSTELVEHYSNQTVNQLTTVESAAKSIPDFGHSFV